MCPHVVVPLHLLISIFTICSFSLFSYCLPFYVFQSPWLSIFPISYLFLNCSVYLSLISVTCSIFTPFCLHLAVRQSLSVCIILSLTHTVSILSLIFTSQKQLIYTANYKWLIAPSLSLCLYLSLSFFDRMLCFCFLSVAVYIYVSSLCVAFSLFHFCSASLLFYPSHSLCFPPFLLLFLTAYIYLSSFPWVSLSIPASVSV